MSKRKLAIAGFSAILLAIAVAIVWAVPTHPYVDGCLTPDDEYDEGGSGHVQSGTYSKMYDRWVSGNGWYLCNDWCWPEEGFDPNGDCDAYNVFNFTDMGYTGGGHGYKYWRVKVHGDCSRTIEWSWQTLNPGTWTAVDANTWGESATGYHISKNEENTPHPIWELKFPCGSVIGPMSCGIIDPKFVDSDSCPPADSWNPPNYGNAPSPPNLPNQGGGC